MKWSVRQIKSKIRRRNNAKLSNLNFFFLEIISFYSAPYTEYNKIVACITFYFVNNRNVSYFCFRLKNDIIAGTLNNFSVD